MTGLVLICIKLTSLALLIEYISNVTNSVYNWCNTIVRPFYILRVIRLFSQYDQLKIIIVKFTLKNT